MDPGSRILLGFVGACAGMFGFLWTGALSERAHASGEALLAGWLISGALGAIALPRILVWLRSKLNPNSPFG